MANRLRNLLHIHKYIKNTPLEKNDYLSSKFNANIFLKREDLQFTRSFKIRGALHKILKNDIHTQLTTASAGNHAQGVAYACNLLNKKGTIFLPNTTPLQKINRIKYYGDSNITIKIQGNNFNESLEEAIEYSNNNNHLFIHPFDDLDIIEGQSTIGAEILDELSKPPDFILCSVGGGGLISGISDVMADANTLASNIKPSIIGVESSGAASLDEALTMKKRVKLENIDNFVDGASVNQIGHYNFDKIIKNKNINQIIKISNRHISHSLINIYQNEGIVLEPAGVMPICALDKIAKTIENKTVVCVLSGGNNDITRYSEMIELNLQYLDLKHYFILEFIQKPNQLKTFVNNILTDGDDITRFEYIKKSNKNYGKVLIGIELQNKDNIHNIIKNLDYYSYNYRKIDTDDEIYELIM